MSESEGARLRGDGVPIVLADGTKVELVFDFDAICEVEETIGSLRDLAEGLAEGPRGQLFQLMAKAVAAGMRHTGEKPSAEEMRGRLDHRQMDEYIDAVSDALTAALPPETTEGKASGPETASPGPSTSTSRSSGSDEASPSSGA